MSQVTARLPDELVEALDAAARDLKRPRAEEIRIVPESPPVIKLLVPEKKGG